MTLEEAQQMILTLQTEKAELIKNNEALTSQIETLTNEKETLQSESEKTINQLKEHNSFLFQRVSQTTESKEEQKQEKSKEKSLADLLLKMGGN